MLMINRKLMNVLLTRCTIGALWNFFLRYANLLACWFGKRGIWKMKWNSDVSSINTAHDVTMHIVVALFYMNMIFIFFNNRIDLLFVYVITPEKAYKSVTFFLIMSLLLYFSNSLLIDWTNLCEIRVYCVHINMLMS